MDERTNFQQCDGTAYRQAGEDGLATDWFASAAAASSIVSIRNALNYIFQRIEVNKDGIK